MKNILSTTAIAALLMSGAAFAEQHTNDDGQSTDTEASANAESGSGTEANANAEASTDGSSDSEMSSDSEGSSDSEMSSDSEGSSDSEMSSDSEGSSDSEMASGDSEMASGDTGPFGTYEEQEELEIFGSDFIGKRIYAAEGEIQMGAEGGVNQDWNDLGEVNDLLMGTDGQIDYAILGIGGFLGIGERDVLVRMDQIEIVQDGDDATDYFLVINATQQQIENAPEFDSTVVNEAEAAAAEAGAAAENAAEETGQAAEEAANETQDAAENAANETEQAAEDAAAATEEAANEAEQSAEDAANEAEQAAEDAEAEVEQETNSNN